MKNYITLKINKMAISEEKYVKYLGLLIDVPLSWDSHIDNLSKKIARSLGVMFKIRPFVTPTILKNIIYYSSLVYPLAIWYSSLGICIWY